MGDAHSGFGFYLSDSLSGIVSDRTDGENGHIGAVFQLSTDTGLDFLHRVAPVYEHTLASRITDNIAAMTWQLG